MRRQQPDKHLKPIVPETFMPANLATTLVRSYALLTPLFGGSPDPTMTDPASFIRATEIRGQLRFWWRACYGGNYATIEAMKVAEDKLWGKAHKKGEAGPAFHETIQLFITIPTGTLVPAFDYHYQGKEWKETAKGIPPYAAFPLQATSKALKSDQNQKPVSNLILTDVKFELTIQYPSTEKKDLEREVTGALWAWETFGGLGGRTRRGFGSIEAIPNNRSDIHFLRPKEPLQVVEWIQKKCTHFEVSKTPAPGNTPCLAHIVEAVRTSTVLYLSNNPILGVLDPPAKSANEAWTNLISKLKKFRQVPGNSPWPETRAVKKMMSENLSTLLEQDLTKYNFPKASLGLPIIFHDAKTDKDLILQGPDKGRERFASPLIFRPLHCCNGEYVGIVLVLTNHELPAQKLMLLEQDKKGNRELGLVSATLPANDPQLMSHLKDEKDVVLAFMKSIKYL